MEMILQASFSDVRDSDRCSYRSLVPFSLAENTDGAGGEGVEPEEELKGVSMS